jgi:2-hydroxychromene-2-carboxylate isomerase
LGGPFEPPICSFAIRFNQCHAASIGKRKVAKLEFYWDVTSPYTYLASTQLDAITSRTNAELALIPFSLKRVLAMTGNALPVACIAKSRHIPDDLQRWSEAYGVEMKMPFIDVRFPIDSDLAMCAAIAGARRSLERPLFLGLFRAYWVKGERLDKRNVLERAIDALDLSVSGRELLEAASAPEVLAELERNTKQAVDRGAFGAPTMFVGDEMFFGNDRLLFVEQALRG